MIIELPGELYKRMIAHGKEGFPEEICGLVAGLRDKSKLEIKKLYPMTNLDASAEHYSMDPKEQFAVVKEVRDTDYEMIGNYHSHPFTLARPSGEDKRLAYDESAIYFILSLQEEPVLKAFSIKNQEEVNEIEIKLI